MLSSTLLYSVSQWGMIVALAKTTRPEVVGQFALGLAIASPVMLLFNMQLRGVVATDATSTHTFEDYLRVRLVTTVAAVLVITGAALTVDDTWLGIASIVLIGVMKAFESVSDVCYGIYQKHERIDLLARSMIARSAGSAVFFIGTIIVTQNLVLALGLSTLAWAMVAVLVDLPTASRFEPVGMPLSLSELRARLPAFRAIVWLAAPLGVVMMLGALNANLPRYALETFTGKYALGIFSALSYIAIAGGAVSDAAGQSLVSSLSRDFAARRVDSFLASVRILLLINLALGAAAIAVAWFFGERILALIYTPEYGDYRVALTILMVGALLNFINSTVGFSLTAARSYKLQVGVLGIAATTTALASIVLIPAQGVEGGAIAICMGAFFQVLAGSLALWQTVRHSYKKGSAS